MVYSGYHAQRVAVAVSNELTPIIIEVTPVNKRIMRLRIHHSLGVISLVSAYAPTEASDLTMKDASDATLEFVVDQCPRQDTLLVVGFQCIVNQRVSQSGDHVASWVISGVGISFIEMNHKTPHFAVN